MSSYQKMPSFVAASTDPERAADSHRCYLELTCLLSAQCEYILELSWVW